MDSYTWHTSVGQLAKTHIQHLCVDNGCRYRTYKGWWSTGVDGERVSKKSGLSVRLDDDDDDDDDDEIDLQAFTIRENW